MEETLNGVPVRYSTKIRVLLYLQRLHSDVLLNGFNELSAWASIPQLAGAAGLFEDTLRVILPRYCLHNWYVERHCFNAEVMNDSRAHWFYRIKNDGLRYLTKACQWYSHYERLATYLNSRYQDEDVVLPGLYVRPVVWRAYPCSREAIQIMWPFSSARDVLPFYTGKCVQVDDIRQARSVCEVLYDAELKPDCINAALLLQSQMAEKAGYRVTVELARKL